MGGNAQLDYSSLLKILELERKKGYHDNAVFGGLQKYLANWKQQNRPAPGISKLLDVDYASLDEKKRAVWMEQLCSSINHPSLTPVKIPKRSAVAAKPVARAKPAVGGLSLDSPVTGIKGISVALGEKFGKLGVKTIRDILYFFPNRHIDYSQRKPIAELSPGEEQTIVSNVWETRITMPGGRRKSTEATLGDESGNIRVIWFNNPYIARQLKVNSRVAVSGKVNIYRGQPVLENPEWELLEDKELVHTGRLVPVYPLTVGLYPRQVRKLVKEAVDGWVRVVTEFLPADIKKSCNLLDLPEAIAQAHFPEDRMMYDRARTRLAFDELFLLQLGVLGKKREWRLSSPSIPLPAVPELLEAFKKSLPFQFTGAQEKVLREILDDIARPQAMSRLLQGDVGSGKTVVATAAILTAVANGKQAAMMAPTEILAEQHFNTVSSLLARSGNQVEEGTFIKSYSGLMSRPVTVALLTGALNGRKKKDIKERVASGTIDIIIGTHALIQKDVVFKQLALAVIDEQHRFGVEQRSALRQKGFNPHVLVMTATPIPRTLSLTLYGDLDLSIIDELPPGRQVIKTKWLAPEQREQAYAFIHKQALAGRQAFIICPLIEESEAVQARAATDEYDRLANDVFPDLKLGLLHGRIQPAEKDKVMRVFHTGGFQILVATPVVEVGIDVPNATVMLVESADRFGLSQLHQFRGRVGRGTEQSYCMLLSERPSEVSGQRLKIIETVQNGFILAEKDLEIRGPGEFFGTRQSGIPDLKMARLSDAPLLECARKEAIKFFEKDPDLMSPEHAALARELVRAWGRRRASSETS